MTHHLPSVPVHIMQKRQEIDVFAVVNRERFTICDNDIEILQIARTLRIKYSLIVGFAST